MSFRNVLHQYIDAAGNLKKAQVFDLPSWCQFIDAVGDIEKAVKIVEPTVQNFNDRLNFEGLIERFGNFRLEIDEWCKSRWEFPEYQKRFRGCGYFDGRTTNGFEDFKETIDTLPWTDKYMLVTSRQIQSRYHPEEESGLMSTWTWYSEWLNCHQIKEGLEFVWVLQEDFVRYAPCLKRTIAKTIPTGGPESGRRPDQCHTSLKTQWECLVHYF